MHFNLNFSSIFKDLSKSEEKSACHQRRFWAARCLHKHAGHHWWNQAKRFVLWIKSYNLKFKRFLAHSWFRWSRKQKTNGCWWRRRRGRTDGLWRADQHDGPFHDEGNDASGQIQQVRSRLREELDSGCSQEQIFHHVTKTSTALCLQSSDCFTFFRCPHMGCNQHVSKGDLVPDHQMKRQIERRRDGDWMESTVTY